MELQFKKAVRQACPTLISVAGTSGSGKTVTALLLAAGLAGNGRVGFLDTENGRGSMYADSPLIMAALPNGYDIMQMDAPFSPERYTQAIKLAEQQGFAVLVIDSASHEYEGIGGCTDIAEKGRKKGMDDWKSAKREHKRFVYSCLSTNMHIIFCLRAREKVKMVKAKNSRTGESNTEVMPIGLQPITEKNFVFEMLLSLLLDESTHYASAIKLPEALHSIFANPHLVTKQDGEKIRKWNETGSAVTADEQLRKRARAIADDGVEAYREFFTALTKAQQQVLAATTHAENKRIAEQSDKDKSAEDAGIPNFTGDWPDNFDGPQLIWNGELYRFDDESGSYSKAKIDVAA